MKQGVKSKFEVERFETFTIKLFPLSLFEKNSSSISSIKIGATLFSFIHSWICVIVSAFFVLPVGIILLYKIGFDLERPSIFCKICNKLLFPEPAVPPINRNCGTSNFSESDSSLNLISWRKGEVNAYKIISTILEP